MGNSKSDITCVLHTDKQFYFASENVNGQLYIEAKKKIPCVRIILQIQGVQSCEFQGEDGTPLKGFRRLINTYYLLQEWGPNNCLQGQYAYPFSFRFLSYLPGSYNEAKSYKASISYNIKSIIQAPGNDRKPIETIKELIIREPQRQGDKMLFGQTFVGCKSCFCFDQGVSRITCYFQKNFYLPDDDCIMICEADNTKCGLDITRIKCELIKVLTLTALNGTQRQFQQSLNTGYFPGIGAHRSYIGDNAERMPLQLTYKEYKKGVHPSTNGMHVKCEYFIIVRPVFSGCFVRTQQDYFKVKLNILQPAKEYETIQQPENWEPDIHQTTQIMLEMNSKNQLLDSMSDNY